MLSLKQQPHNSVWIKADSQEELGLSFMRFQEHYESLNPDFRHKVFTVGQLRAWYSSKYGADTYHKDWVGFNFPSKVLIPFKQGLFDPLTPEEQNLLEFFKYRHDNFYIIGAQDQATLRHELAHALYSTNSKYAQAVNKLCDSNKSKMKKVRQFILNKGYHLEHLNDELQAYITDKEDPFIMNNTPIDIVNKLVSLYERYKENE